MPQQSEYQNSQEQTLSIACHLAAVAGFLVYFGNVLGPLVLWLLVRGKSPVLDQAGKEALNFQIFSLLICALLFLAGSLYYLNNLGGNFTQNSLFMGTIGVFTVVGIFNFFFSVRAAYLASQGKIYKYPVTIRFVR